MDSMVFESIWLILVILRLRTMQNYLTPKQGSASSNTKETPTREGNEPSACIYMDCIIYSKLSSPCAGGPVRVGAMHRLCSSGLSPNEGVGESRVTTVLFAIFIFRFLQCYQKSYQNTF